MYFPTILSTLTLFLLISKNALAVTAAPLPQSASDSSSLQTYGSVSVGPRSSIVEETLVKRALARVPILPKATYTKLWKWKASDLKSKDYRSTALANNDGAYVKTACGTKVKWQKGANGEAEHIIEPGSHIKDALNKFSIPKNHPFAISLKGILNDKDNLSMLDGPTNKAKAHITADPNRNPKDKAPAKHYMQQPEIKKKASITLRKIRVEAKKHKMLRVYAAIKGKVKMSWSHIKRDLIDG